MLLCCMETVKDVFEIYKNGLKDVYAFNEIESITKLVINNICNLTNAKIKAFPDFILTEDELSRLSKALAELQTGKPVQYVLGTTEFYGLPFIVNKSVLIPRPETEELVEWAIKSVEGGEVRGLSGLKKTEQVIENKEQATENTNQVPVNILDIGTGSGCIAISLKKHVPYFNVWAIDISAEALATAKENAGLNKVEIDFIEADILNLKSDIENPKFEIIISNPPYVTELDKQLMHNNVTDFEPHTALFVPDDDPLLFYKAIADFAFKQLTENGLLFLEINESLGMETVELLKNKGFINIELRKDMSGKDRIVKATR